MTFWLIVRKRFLDVRLKVCRSMRRVEIKRFYLRRVAEVVSMISKKAGKECIILLFFWLVKTANV